MQTREGKSDESSRDSTAPPVNHPLKLTVADLRWLRNACVHAAEDRETYAQAWTPQFGKGDAESRRIVRKALADKARYQRLQARVQAELNRRAAGKPSKRPPGPGGPGGPPAAP